MKDKYTLVSDLAKDTAAKIVKNKEAWTEFLKTASWLTKYSFYQQMLIYAQCPDATACASLEVWNKKMSCWVNKGAKGIALISEKDAEQKLTYVFDIANVHMDRKLGRKPYLWELREEHQNIVMERLDKIYGSTRNDCSFEDRIIELADRMARNCCEEMAGKMGYFIEGSYLEELDEYSLKIRLRDTLRDSIGYTLFSRFGLDASEYPDTFSFDYIKEFSTLSVLSYLGSAAAEHCKNIVMESGKAIFLYDKNSSQERVENHSNVRYNSLNRESSGGIAELHHRNQEAMGHTTERGMEHGNDISEGRRLFAAQYSAGRAAGGDIDKVRADAESLFERGAGGVIRRDAANGEIEKPFAAGTGTGRAEGRTNYKADDGEGGNYRAVERGRSDALGAAEEPHSNGSGGNRKGGIDLHLDSGIKKPDSEKLPGFLMSENIEKQPKKGKSW